MGKGASNPSSPKQLPGMLTRCGHRRKNDSCLRGASTSCVTSEGDFRNLARSYSSVCFMLEPRSLLPLVTTRLMTDSRNSRRADLDYLRGWWLQLQEPCPWSEWSQKFALVASASIPLPRCQLGSCDNVSKTLVPNQLKCQLCF